MFFAQKVLRKLPGNWTFVVVTDRNELDDQIYKNFAAPGAVTERRTGPGRQRRAPAQLLQRGPPLRLHADPEVPHRARARPIPMLSERSDIIVITDEAHRSQYDMFALNMRNALPNAAFLGFTGTPLIAGEEKTREVFGDYVSVYDFRAVDRRRRHRAAVLREPHPRAAADQREPQRGHGRAARRGRARRGAGEASSSASSPASTT